MSDKPGYRRPQAGTQPDYLHPAYESTNLRSPSQPLVFLPHSLSEITGPTIGAERINEKDNDLTAQHDGEPQGERIIIHGRVLDENGLPMFSVGSGLDGERQREMANRFGVNLVMYVMTGNYKSDQVHVPALLDRLRQEEAIR